MAKWTQRGQEHVNHSFLELFSQDLEQANDFRVRVNNSWSDSSSNPAKDVDEAMWADWLQNDKRFISSISVRVETESVDVTSFDDPTRMFLPGRLLVRVYDEQGHEVPEQLRQMVAAEVQRLTEELVEKSEQMPILMEVLQRWNEKNDPAIESSHPWPCLYKGDDRWPCVCQRPVLWDKEFNDSRWSTRQWHCDCCQEPWATERHALCDVCQDHEYSISGSQIEADHRNRLI